MLQAVLNRLRTVADRIAARIGDDADDKDGDGSRFVPSVLDASVRYAHGGSGDEIDRELADIEEEAQRLEAHSRRK